MPKTYTVREVAELLGYSTNSIYTFLREKRIKGVRVGKGRFRIPEPEVTRLLGAQSGTRLQDVTADTEVISGGLPQNRGPAELRTEVHVPVHYRVDVPNLFDWFSTLSAIILSISVSLYRGKFEEFYFPGFEAWIPLSVVFLSAGGIGLLLGDVTGYVKSVWQRVFRGFLFAGFAVLFTVSYLSRDTGMFLFSSTFAFAVLLSFIRGLSGVWMFSLYLTVSSALVPFALRNVPEMMLLKGLPMYLHPEEGTFMGYWFAATLLVAFLAWRSHGRKRFIFWLIMVILGIFHIGVAWIFALNGLWGRAFLYVLTGLTSIFVPGWDCLVFTSRKDRRTAFGVIGVQLLLFAFAAILVRLVTGGMLEFTKAELLAKTGFSAISVDNDLRSVRESLESAAANPLYLKELTAKKPREEVFSGLVRTIFESDRKIAKIALLDAESGLISSYPLAAGDGSGMFPMRDVVLAAFASGRTSVSGEYRMAGSNDNVIDFAVPVSGDSGTSVGMLVGTVSLRTVGERLQKLSSPDRDEHIAVFHSTGEILYAPVDLRDQIGSLTDVLQGENGVTETKTITGIRMLVAYQKTASYPWYTVIAVPVREVYRLSRSPTYTVAALFLVSMIIYSIFLFMERKGASVSGEDGP